MGLKHDPTKKGGGGESLLKKILARNRMLEHRSTCRGHCKICGSEKCGGKRRGGEASH